MAWRASARSIPGRWSRPPIRSFRCKRSITSSSIFRCRKRILGKSPTTSRSASRPTLFPGREFSGTLSAINPAVDQATRNVKLQATLNNQDHALRAGMFAKVEVLLPEKNSVLYIPATSVAYAPYGDSVYVIEKKHDEETKQDELVLRQQFVRLGETRGDFVAVTEGLKAGQEVVSTGAFKLRNGMNVVIDNKLAPKAQLNPTPSDT